MILRTPLDEGRNGPRINDDREPRHYWHELYPDRAHPIARGLPSDVGFHRHVFDALVVYGKEIVQEPEQLPDGTDGPWPDNHREFRLNLTCVQCGQIVGLEGILTQDETYKRVDPEPLRAKHLLAQHTSSWGAYRPWSAWAVYAGDTLVGAMASAQTARGRVYVEGYVDDADGTKHRAEAPTAIGVLRKLASAHNKPAA